MLSQIRTRRLSENTVGAAGAAGEIERVVEFQKAILDFDLLRVRLLCSH